MEGSNSWTAGNLDASGVQCLQKVEKDMENLELIGSQNRRKGPRCVRLQNSSCDLPRFLLLVDGGGDMDGSVWWRWDGRARWTTDN